ncbi:MAG: phosphopentomutase [Clostridia bacterium]|nr:phosphopentomutase [Clostridia bacterium]
MEYRRVFLVVLDSCGIGNAPDAADFGDEGAFTLKSVMNASPALPNLASLGLFSLPETKGLSDEGSPVTGDFASACEKSRGKDTTVGHWEIAGVISPKPQPTYPNGFPDELLKTFLKKTGCKGYLCNLPYSGTEVIKDYGGEHIKTGFPIVYTSADSVFQIAAHEEIIPVEQLYEICEITRNEVCVGKHAVGRIIARPFRTGENGFYRTENRHDYSLEPHGETMLDRLKAAGFDVISVGKIKDVFAGRGVTEAIKARHNPEGEEALLAMQERDFNGLCFVNLVDFDMVYGHRNDIDGYANALEHFDVTLGKFLKNMREDDLLMITADHGCDPGFKGTDHTRENIPILIKSNRTDGKYLGTKKGFDCIAETICRNFGVEGFQAEILDI